MSLQGVYSRMHDGERSKPFRNQAQIVVSESSMIYSARPMPGEKTRTEIQIRWHDESAFSVDWSPVCRHWSKAATFRPHIENGVPGLEEQGLHFWRYEPAATQKTQESSQSLQTRTPKPRSIPSPWPGASTPHDDVATTKTPAFSSPTERPKSYKICVAGFDPEPYGLEYLRLTVGDKIQDVEAPEDCEEWATGRLVLADDRLSPPGWYPRAFAQ